MSEKKRQKKDGEDKNKNNQRMREANEDSGKKNVASAGQNKRGKSRGEN
jgi:hypothetical protein